MVAASVALAVAVALVLALGVAVTVASVLAFRVSSSSSFFSLKKFEDVCSLLLWLIVQRSVIFSPRRESFQP